MERVPLPVAVSAVGVRFLGHPAPAGDFSLPRGRPTGGARRRTPSGLSCCACSSCDRAGRLLYPGDGGAFPAGGWPPAGTCRSPAASPYGPAGTSHLRGALSRGVNTGSLTFAHHPRATGCRPTTGKPHGFPPIFSSPADPGWNKDGFGFDPGLRTPQLPTTHAEAETGHQALARVLHPQHHQSSLHWCLPLALMHPHVAPTRTSPRAPPPGAPRPGSSPPPEPAGSW